MINEKRLKAQIRRMEQKGAKPGEVWKVWFECMACAYSVHQSDSYCRNCGARLLGVKT